ncbi:hypothetical protein MMC26_000876 [Xylographa opegraphella]|nr:hypothetical protein [Xylographa opegraphella]
MASLPPRSRVAQSASAPIPASLTHSLQKIPTGQSPLQYYVGKRQAFEQAPMGQATQRKDMAAHLKNIMAGYGGGGAR